MDRSHSPAGAPRTRTRRVSPRKKQLEDTLDLLYRRRWIILGTFALIAAAAAAYQFTRTPAYRAEALVLVDLTKASNGDQQLDFAGTNAFVRDNRSVTTELFVLRNSRGIHQRVTERLADENGRRPPGAVTFTQADRTVFSAISIAATSPDPEAAAALANAYAQEYVEQTQTSSRSYLTAQRELLEDQKKRLDEELAAAEGQFEGAMASGGATLDGQAGNINARIASLKSDRDVARMELRAQRASLAELERQIQDISPQLEGRAVVNNQAEIARLDAQIEQLRNERQTKAQYEERRDRDPAQRADIAALDRRIASLERDRERLAREETQAIMGVGGQASAEGAMAYVADLRNQASQMRVSLSGLQERIQTLNGAIGSAQGELGRVPAASTAMLRSQRDLAQAQQTQEYVTSRLSQIRVAEEAEPGYARILRAASVPGGAMNSGQARGLALALLGGLGLGLALAFGMDKLDNRVHKPEDVSALGLSVLEAIPDLAPLIRDELGGAQAIEVDGRPMAAELVALHAPLSPASETYRHLRTGVQFSRPDVVVHTVLVTSAGAGEGKSTTAANLAITLAQAGRRTVLIDADIRRPRQQDLFGMPADYGLAQLLEQDIRDADGLRAELDASFQRGVDGLYVVPTGAVAAETHTEVAPGQSDRMRVPNPSELLGSVEMRALISTLKEVADVIIIDTPPVLAATDAVLLSTQADATILVTRAGGTKAGDVEQALAHLDDVGAHVVGGVLNGFSLEHAFGYAYSYGHYSRYGPYSKYGAYTEDSQPRSRRPKSRIARGNASA